jgi:hypothetical protein
MYVDLVSQHRSLVGSEIFPRNPSCGELNLKVLGNFDIEAIDCDGAARVIASVHSSSIFEPSLNK